jgi:hypothetical protein
MADSIGIFPVQAALSLRVEFSDIERSCCVRPRRKVLAEADGRREDWHWADAWEPSTDIRFLIIARNADERLVVNLNNALAGLIRHRRGSVGKYLFRLASNNAHPDGLIAKVRHTKALGFELNL